MRIDGSGNVGIGTSSPAARLQVNAATDTIKTYGSSYNQQLHDSASGGFSQALWQINGTSKALVGAGGGNMIINTAGDSTANMIFSTGSSTTERMRIDTSGNLLVGTSSALSQTGRATFVGTGNGLVTQCANGNTAIQTTNTSGTDIYYAAIFGNNGNSFSTCGLISVSGTTTIYAVTSDYRLKEDVQPMTGALAKVAQLKPVTYKWKIDGSNSNGFIAHELAEVCPQAVSGEKDAIKADGSIMPQGIDTSFLVATLTAAIQEQQALIISLTARIAALESN
jgi:hypothetical protein